MEEGNGRESDRGEGASDRRRRSRRVAATTVIESHEDETGNGSYGHQEFSLDLFEIGQMIFAKIMKSKAWSMAEIMKIDTRTQELEVQFLEEKIVMKLPLHPECIQSINEKRKRKFRVNFDEDERAFNEAIGSKKKPKKNPIESVAKVKVSDNETPTPARISTNVKNLKLTEAATESSLKENLSLLRPFVSPKVYEKIQNSPTVSLPRHQLTKQPKSIVKATLRDYQVTGVRHSSSPLCELTGVGVMARESVSEVD
jgi:hypothetical protein